VSDILTNARIFLEGLGWRDALDVLLVAFLAYQLLKLIRGTQAAQLLVGLVVLLVIGFAAGQLHLRLLNYIFSNGGTVVLTAIIVLFQPELRRALDQVGRLNPVRNVILGQHQTVGIQQVVEEVIRAVGSLSERRTGALIVFERETGLENVAATGVRMNAEITAELLATIFYTGTPLHDGAAIIRDGRVIAAGCVLPLADTIPGVGRMGTRHRAALGLTLQGDAVVLIVSEETGLISLAHGGRIYRGLDTKQLTDMLVGLLGGKPQQGGRVVIPRPFLRSAGAGVRAIRRR
jgi:diadenylate cyclase